MVFYIYIVCCFIVYTQGVTYEVIQDRPGDYFECNSTVTIRCMFAVSTSVIVWKIASDVKATKVAAAQCFSSTCHVNPSYAGKYNFTFDRLADVSNITIMKVTAEHESLEFRCDDGSEPDPIKRAVVVYPNNVTAAVTSEWNFHELSVTTSCIYPTDNINFTWYSGKTNGTDQTILTETNRTVTLCSSDSISANKGAQVTSILQITGMTVQNANISRSQEERHYKVLINYTSGHFLFEDNKFVFQDIWIANTASSYTSIDGKVCSKKTYLLAMAVVKSMYTLSLTRSIVDVIA